MSRTRVDSKLHWTRTNYYCFAFFDILLEATLVCLHIKRRKIFFFLLLLFLFPQFFFQSLTISFFVALLLSLFIACQSVQQVLTKILHFTPSLMLAPVLPFVCTFWDLLISYYVAHFQMDWNQYWKKIIEKWFLQSSRSLLPPSLLSCVVSAATTRTSESTGALISISMMGTTQYTGNLLGCLMTGQ